MFTTHEPKIGTENTCQTTGTINRKYFEICFGTKIERVLFVIRNWLGIKLHVRCVRKRYRFLAPICGKCGMGIRWARARYTVSNPDEQWNMRSRLGQAGCHVTRWDNVLSADNNSFICLQILSILLVFNTSPFKQQFNYSVNRNRRYVIW